MEISDYLFFGEMLSICDR